MKNRTQEIYDWMNQLVEDGNFPNVSYDDNWLFATDMMSLYQVSRKLITFKAWQLAHEEAWQADGYSWHHKPSLACGDYELEGNGAPKLEACYRIVGDAVQSSLVDGKQVFKASFASRGWVAEQERFFGLLFDKQRIADALALPLFGAKLHISLLNCGALRIANKPTNPTVFAYIMHMDE